MKHPFVSYILPGILAGGAYSLLLFGLRWNPVIALLIAVALFVALRLVLQPRQRIGSMDVDNIPQGKELRKLLDEAQANFDSIVELLNQISDLDVRRRVGALKELSGRILGYLEEHPEKLWNAEMFINYYQETARSILEHYVELQKSNLQTETAEDLKARTKQSLDTLNEAFEQQFQKLMREDLLDMDQEMRVLDEMMKLE